MSLWSSSSWRNVSEYFSSCCRDVIWNTPQHTSCFETHHNTVHAHLTGKKNSQFNSRHFPFTFTDPSTVGGCWGSQPVFSIFLCSPLPSVTWWTPGLPIPWCCLPTSFCCYLVFFSLSLCPEKWFWPNLPNRRHAHATSACLFMRVRRSLCGQIACWILAQTSSVVTQSSYQMHSILWYRLIPWLVFFFEALLANATGWTFGCFIAEDKIIPTSNGAENILIKLIFFVFSPSNWLASLVRIRYP